MSEPRQFDGLAGFTAKCERAVAADAGATVLFAHTRRLKVERLRMARVGPEARVVGWDAEQRVTVLEVSAAGMLAAIRAGLLVDRASVSARYPPLWMRSRG